MKRNIRGALGRIVLWTVLCTAGWWFISFLIPGLPTPLHAARALFGMVKTVSDDVYTSVNRESLEQSAREVLAAAEEQRGTDTVLSDGERLPAARRSQLPAIPAREDSALRAELRAISTAPPVAGRVINVLLIGVDSRMGVTNARGDALHLFTINPDSAIVEIMSIPRDTYVDLGYPDTTSFNIIANARALGHDGLMRRVSELTKRGPVKYYAEVGFSQAMGVLEILGYKDPVSTLKFLRTRKTLPGGDIQRSHNQAVFLRQNLLQKFSLLTGATGELILSAGLHFVGTNMSKDFCQGLVYALQQRGFPQHRPDAVRLRMLPIYKIRLKDMTADSATIARTLAQVDRTVGEEDTHITDVARYLRNQHRLAQADSARPGKVVYRLRRFHDQHAWVQIQDKTVRRAVRDSLSFTLERAYRRLGKHEEAERIVAARRAEDLLLPGEHRAN